MSENWISFFIGFAANFVSDGLIAVAVYLAITQRSERKQIDTRILQALAMLKAETETNAARATRYLKALDGRPSQLKALFPLRYTRGAWNALKESGFLPLLKDPTLVYRLLRVNELVVMADASLFRIRKALRGGKSASSIVPSAKQDSQRLLVALESLLAILRPMKLPEVAISDFDNGLQD